MITCDFLELQRGDCGKELLIIFVKSDDNNHILKPLAKLPPIGAATDHAEHERL